MLHEPRFQRIMVQAKILDVAAPEVDVVPPDALANGLLVGPSEGEHLVRGIDTDHLARRTDDLAGHVADLSSSRAQVEHHLTLSDESAGVTAAVVAIHDLWWEDREERRVVVDRTAKLGDLLVCAFCIPSADRFEGGVGVPGRRRGGAGVAHLSRLVTPAGPP